MRPPERPRADTVLVVGPALAGAGRVAAALRGRLEGAAILEPANLHPGRVPDAVVFVTSAAAPMSACDAALFASVTGPTDAVVGAVTKIDVHRTWQSVLEINRTAQVHPAGRRAVQWVGVAADPEIGPVVIGPLVDAVRAELDDEHRRRRNQLRARQWALQQRIAERECEAAAREATRAQADRRSTARVRVQQARIHLVGQARARCAALRADALREAGEVSRQDLAAFDGRVLGRAQQIADDFDATVADRVAEICAGDRTAVPVFPPSPPVRSYLPSPRTAAQEDRLAAVFGTGFGLGIAVTLGRFLTELVPSATAAVIPVCAAAGVALAAWVVRTRRLVSVRAARERWAAEVAAGVRNAMEERVLVAESALLEAHRDVPARGIPRGGAPADTTLDGWIGELARVRAELDEGFRPNAGHDRPGRGDNPN